MKTLPLSVLFYEGPMARAYLEMISRAGFKVEAVIRMVPKPGMLARLLPRGMRGEMLAYRQEKRANHWPRVLAGQFPALCQEMTSKIEATLDLGEGFIAALRSGRDLSEYGPVETIEVDNLKDPELVRALAAKSQHPVLFTGGGLLPPAVFEVDGLRLLHVHPGYLPDVRGADGLLWSTLVRGRPGVSAFVMAPGLDEGDLLLAMETAPLQFEIPPGEFPGDRDLYRMAYSYYDPVLRVYALRQLLPSLEAGVAPTGTPQDTAAGRTYHFMQGRLRHSALARLFRRTDDVLAAR